MSETQGTDVVEASDYDRIQILSSQAQKLVVEEQKSALDAYGINPQDFARVLSAAIIRQKELLACDPRQVMDAIRQCCMDGLMPNGRDAMFITNEGNRTCRYMPMGQGLNRLFHAATKMSIITGVIYEGDERDIVPGENGHFRVKPNLNPSERGGIIAGYAYVRQPATDAHGEILHVRLLYPEDIENLKSAGKSKAWKLWPARMIEKSAGKSLINSLRWLIPVMGSPAIEQLNNVLMSDDFAYGSVPDEEADDMGPVMKDVQGETIVNPAPSPKSSTKGRRKKTAQPEGVDPALPPAQAQIGQPDHGNPATVTVPHPASAEVPSAEPPPAPGAAPPDVPNPTAEGPPPVPKDESGDDMFGALPTFDIPQGRAAPDTGDVEDM